MLWCTFAYNHNRYSYDGVPELLLTPQTKHTGAQVYVIAPPPPPPLRIIVFTPNTRAPHELHLKYASS